jgi:hypothetical protein
MIRTLSLLACAGLLACGGDDSSSINLDSGGTSDTSTDQSAADSSKSDGSGNDASPTDAGIDVLGIDVVIPDASFACNDPTTCDGGLCCASIVLGAGNPPTCPINSISSACQSTCTTNLAFSCATTETVRFCNQKSDCTEKGITQCCHFQQGNQKVTFCASAAVAQFATSCL